MNLHLCYTKILEKAYPQLYLPKFLKKQIKIPALETVAGVVNFKNLISKIIFMCGFKGILSFEASVKSLLSSMTELIDSIQFASKSPSRILHF